MIALHKRCAALAVGLLCAAHSAHAESLAADIDGSGIVDAVDVQLVINAALGLPTPFDANVDGQGSVTSVDVQSVINILLGDTVIPTDGPIQYTYEVMNRYPHDVNAFTQGLVIDNGVLYEGTGLYGQSTLRRVALLTGAVEQSTSIAANFFGEGIDVLGDRIVQLTWRESTGFIYDRNTFTSLGTFNYASEGWGITSIGDEFVMSDGTPTLRWLEPQNFTVVRSVEVMDGTTAIQRLNELEYIEGEIWANIWLTDRIARIDPVSGQVVGWVDLIGLLPTEDRSPSTDVLNGIAYDAPSRRIFLTGKRWPYIYEVRIVPQS